MKFDRQLFGQVKFDLRRLYRLVSKCILLADLMPSLLVSEVPPGSFDINCKDIVSVEGRHGDTKFRKFVIPADTLDDFVGGGGAGMYPYVIVRRMYQPRKAYVSLLTVWMQQASEYGVLNRPQ